MRHRLYGGVRGGAAMRLSTRFIKLRKEDSAEDGSTYSRNNRFRECIISRAIEQDMGEIQEKNSDR